MELKIFKDYPELRYGLSEREDGSMKITGDPTRDADVLQNRERFLNNRGINRVVFVPRLAHGNSVSIVTKEILNEHPEVDGLVTEIPDIFLTITVADCFPLYFYDPVKKIVGLAHAGWRGVGKNITKNVIKTFRESFNSLPQNILLGIGPGIKQCHFTVQEDKFEYFLNKEPEAAGDLRAYEQFIEKRGRGEYAIDLEGIIIEQARSEGLQNIEAAEHCTYCMADIYFSYRRDKPEILETMLAYIGRNCVKASWKN